MVNCELTPLFAGIDDWLQFLVPAVFVIIWIISQVMGVGGQKRAPPQQRPARPPKPAGGLAREIESFLKQVQQERADPQPPQQAAAVPQQPAQPARAQRQPELVKPLRPDVVEAELVEPLARTQPRLKPLSEHEPRPPKKRPRRSARTEREKADAVDQADEKMMEHVHQVFDHDLGALADTSDAIHEKAELKKESGAVDIPTTSQAVRDMLAEPESVRKAVILSEILRRPEQRW